MADSSNVDRKGGWETLYQHGAFPPRYQTQAAPNDSVVEWADTLPIGARLLDVGSGIGRHVIYLAKRGFRMSGVDLSPTGIQTTREACATHQLEFDGHVGSMSVLPWGDGTFDGVLSTSTISHDRRADIEKTLAEIRRVLKPGGVLLVDFLHKETLSYQETRQQAAEGKLTEVEPDTFVDESSSPDPLEDAFLPHHFTDEAEVRDLLRDYEILKLYAYLPGRTPDGGFGRRGNWIAWARKPL